MRILIADDEKLVRFSLKNMLEELSFSFEIVGEAQNGQEMIDLTKEFQPEIVFVDIKMPKINGLQALKTLKKDFPEIEWIILTGYSEFSYVQEALKLGASDYLLKPPAPAELEEVIRKFINKKRQSLQMENRDFERKINFHFNNMATVETELWPLISSSFFQGALIVFDSTLSEKTKAEFRLLFCRELRNIIDSTQSNEIRTAVFCLADGALAIASAYGFSAQLESAKGNLKRLFSRIEKAALDSSEQRHYVTIMKTGECNSLQGFQSAIDKLNELSFIRFVAGINKAVSYQSIIEINESDVHRSISEKLERINNAVQVSSIPEIGECINTLYNSDLQGIDLSLQTKIIEFFGLLFDYNIDDFPTLKWQDKLKVKIFQKVQTENGYHGHQDTIQQIISFLNANYMKDISISLIAEDFKITPNYLSTIFHQKAGTTFLKYLTRLRINKAEEMLLETDMKVQEISKEIGYASTRYFAKAFKKINGCTPSEFKQTR